MKTIRILFYTDRITLNTEGDDECVCDLRRFIPLKLAGIATVESQVMVRLGPVVNPAVKLTLDLLKDFDELWVFGFRSDNDSSFMFGEDEVQALCEWMKEGGVMMTGDHSEYPSSNACSAVPHESFRAMGFALGSKVPRARQLRVWTGLPTNCPVDAYNTQVPSNCSSNLDDLCLQSDANPQSLEPMQYPPHFLFTYDYDAHDQPIPITHFPDHAHVGHVIDNPDVFDSCWPARPPFPEVVAKGRDKRPFAEPHVYNLVVAYDGDPAGVGRIVSDASFHHFINENLAGLPERDAATNNPKPGTPLDEIAQYYANLAYWLAPKKLRDEIKRDLLFRAANNLNVLETFGNGPAKLGRVAQQALFKRVGRANLRRILNDGAEKSFEDQFLTYLLTGSEAPEGFDVLGHEYLLGRVIEEYYESLREKGLSPFGVTDDVITGEVIVGALEKTFAAQDSDIGGLTHRLMGKARGLITSSEAQSEDSESGGSQN